MPDLLLNTIALDPNRWTAEKQPYFELADLLGPVVAADFRDLECWQYHLSTLDDAAVETLAERMEALGVTFPIVGLYPALHLDGAARDREWAAVQTLVERAARLGAEAVKLFAGRFGSDEAESDDFERSAAFMRDLIASAAERDLTVIAETHPDTLCDSVPATERFLDAVGDDRLRLCYQPFDFTDTKRTVADYRVLRDRIVHIHLQGRRDDRMCLLEEADVDYRTFLGVLEADAFDGALSIEFVKDCVVERPEDFDLGRVQANAQRDRAFVEAAMPRME